MSGALSWIGFGQCVFFARVEHSRLNGFGPVQIGQVSAPPCCSPVARSGDKSCNRPLVASLSRVLAVIALSLGSPAFGQGAGVEAASAFVLPRDVVEQRDANPFRFAGEVVIPSARSWPRYDEALERHPTTESCLTEDARGGASLNLLAYDWMGINGRYAHEICLYRVWTALGSPDVITSWMSEFNFTVREGEYPPESAGVERFGRIVSGYWSWEETTARSSLGGRGIQRLLDNVFFEPTIVLTATFQPGGGLDYAAVSYIRE